MASLTANAGWSASAFHTSIGWCALGGRGEGSRAVLSSLTIGHRSADRALAQLDRVVGVPIPRRAWNAPLVARIVAMLEGAPDDFRDVKVDLDHLAPFSKRVVQFCRKLAWGQTSSYAALAALAGSPGAARAVGQVMAGNRTPLVVPCHRVVGAGGRLGGFSAPQGLALKRWLLDLESGKLRQNGQPAQVAAASSRLSLRFGRKLRSPSGAGI